ncbi:MAG: 50S ribosomal protein L11 methyltransferase [Armatimonadetes bacterium]|nr:50S ribosomal protein L11 methyltransferase [Armatimonadota bacterium]
MRWARLTVETKPDTEEAVAFILTEACGGVSIAQDCINAWLPLDDRLEPTLLRVRDRLDEIEGARSGDRAGSTLSVTPVEDDNWTLAYREFFRPVQAGRFWIKPPWSTEDDDLQPKDSIALILDPGMAFGTGHHPTTQMMLEALSENPPQHRSVLDVGAGSAVLSIAAARLGASRVVAVEVDPVAEENARLNIALNSVESQVEYKVQDGPPGEECVFDLALMNIVASVIARLAPAVERTLKSGALLACSGVIEERAEEVRQRLIECGFVHVETRSSAEWRAIIARKR